MTKTDRNMKPFSLDHLTPTEFEEFCHDLLDALGFVNISWRKGTGLPTSPSDRGRDIECQLERTDVDGNKQLETWFVECKHHLEGVPPTQLQGILSWATAKNPDTVLVIVSNFLSNPAKDYLSDYQRENRPRFRIKVWEKPDIEKLTLGKAQLLKRYRVVGEFPFLAILHPAHLLYIKKLQFNTLDYLFTVLDGLDARRRDEVLSWVHHAIVRPRYRRSVSGKETLKELMIDDVSHEAFRTKCYQTVNSGAIDEVLLVFLIVTFTLHAWTGAGDTTSIDEVVHRMEAFRDFAQQLMSGELPLQELGLTDEEIRQLPSDKEGLERVVGFAQKSIESAPADIRRNYELYEYFCENVVRPLLLENIFLGKNALRSRRA